jgi:hypothetical protein
MEKKPKRIRLVPLPSTKNADIKEAVFPIRNMSRNSFNTQMGSTLTVNLSPKMNKMSPDKSAQELTRPKR